MRRILVGLLLAVLALALADVGAGLGHRLVTGKSLYYDVVDPDRGANRVYRISSPIYSHDLAPNMDTDACWGAVYRIKTNSLGFKDREVREVALHATGPRVLFIGDSFTEGVGHPYADTFVGRVDDRLRGRGIEVLNAGVSSYSPAIYYRKTRNLLEERGLEFSHLVVFLDLSDVQDEAEDYEIDADDNVVNRLETPSAAIEFMRENSVIFAAARYLKLRRQQEAASLDAEKRNPLNASIDNPRGLWTVRDDLYRSYGERGLAIMSEHMDQLLRVAKAHGVDVTVVVYPWPTQIANRDLDSRQVRFWRDWAGQRGVRFIDLFPGFVSNDDAENRRTIQDLFTRDDYHWNARGHQRVADLFLEQFPLATAQPPSDAAARSVPPSGP